MPGQDVRQSADLSPAAPSWRRQDQPPILERADVHIWRVFIPDIPRNPSGSASVFTDDARPSSSGAMRPYVEINDAPPKLELYGAWLTADERDRASRYRFDADRRRFAWTRGILRTLLGFYAGCPPARIQFGEGEKGKLHLSPPHEGLHFNVSHSHEWALIALARDREVGVDVEHHRPLHHDLFDIATRFFAPPEVRALRALAPAEQEPAFFRIWSRKEAYIKATGEGVSAGLDTFEVSIGPESAVRLRVPGTPAEDTRWMMRSLDVAPDYGAAIAVEAVDGRDVELKLWEW
jgi:4'-phosphopantetheinyl transferase